MKSKVPANNANLMNIIIFLCLALLWSGSFINIKVVVDKAPPVFCAMLRVLISVSFLSILFVCIRKKISFFPDKFWRIWFAGLINQAFPFALLFFGEKFIAPALASIINSTVTIWALLLGSILFKDFSQWTPIKIAGVFLGFLGIVLIFLPFLYGNENNIIGILALIGMAICYALGSLINQHIIFKHMKVNFESNLIHQHILSVIFLFLLSFLCETWPSWPTMLNLGFIASLLYLGILATGVAWIMYFYLTREWGAVRTISVMYLVPALAIVWDALFLHLIPPRNELVGMFTILLGVTLIQWVRRPVLDSNISINSS